MVPGWFLFHDQPVPRGHRHSVLRDQAARASTDAGAAGSVFLLLNASQWTRGLLWGAVSAHVPLPSQGEKTSGLPFLHSEWQTSGLSWSGKSQRSRRSKGEEGQRSGKTWEESSAKARYVTLTVANEPVYLYMSYALTFYLHHARSNVFLSQWTRPHVASRTHRSHCHLSSRWLPSVHNGTDTQRRSEASLQWCQQWNRSLRGNRKGGWPDWQ